jgi:hypothetical protein
MNKIIGIEVNLSIHFSLKIKDNGTKKGTKFWNNAWSSYTNVISDATVSWGYL